MCSWLLSLHVVLQVVLCELYHCIRYRQFPSVCDCFTYYIHVAGPHRIFTWLDTDITRLPASLGLFLIEILRFASEMSRGWFLREYKLNYVLLNSSNPPTSLPPSSVFSLICAYLLLTYLICLIPASSWLPPAGNKHVHSSSRRVDKVVIFFYGK